MHNFKKMLSKLFKSGMYEYCNIEAVDSKDTFVLKDGGLMSVVKIKGARQIIGQESINEVVNSLGDKLDGIVKDPGHKVQFVFERDPKRSRREVERNITPLQRSMRNIGMNMNSLLEERVDLLAEKTASESSYMVLYTNTDCLTKYDHKNALADRTQLGKKTGLGQKPGEFGQSPFVVFTSLRERHSSFVSGVSAKFSDVLDIETLNTHDALREIRKCIDYAHTSDDWNPLLLGDAVKPRLIKESGYQTDISHIMHPDISYQLFSQEPKVSDEDNSIVRMGSQYISPMLIDIQQRKPTPFAELFTSVHMSVPWRISFMFETGHKKIRSKVSNKLTMASLLAWSSSQNKLIKKACEEIIEYADENVTLLGCQITACTWGESINEVRKNKSILYQQLQSWGNMDVIDEQGDAIAAWMDTIPGVTEKHVATPAPIFLTDALYMIPISRPSSPWDTGSVLFRTQDCKLFPIMPISPLQTAWSEIVFAPPGFGKSFYSSACNLGLILKPGNKQLPRITIVDIGFSSKMFVDLIRDSLPEKLKYLAQSYKINMTKEFAINPFDTPLGCQFPLSLDREFVVNFVTLALTPAGTKEAIPRLPELVGFLVDLMYEKVSEEKSPNKYEPGTDKVVDAVLKEHSIMFNENTTWLRIVKRLYGKGLYYEAIRAQRFAVPTMSDASGVLSSDQNLKDTFGTAKMPNGEPMIDYVMGMLLTLTKEFPVLSCPTAFDIGAARIVSLDLSSVAKGGSDQADKRTALMYMLATNVGTREFFRHEDLLPEYPEEFRAYHKREIEKEALTPKRLVMDEFHKTKGQAALRNQTLVYIREGRKFLLQVSILSQLMEDFDDAMINAVNNIVILSPGLSDEEAKNIRSRFGLQPDTYRYMKRYVNGPSPEGSSMIYLGTIKGVKSGRTEQCLRLTVGPREMWAYSTTHQDVYIRKYMAEQHGLDVALSVLATEFPGGTAVPFLGNYTDRELDTDDADENEFLVIANKIYAESGRKGIR